MRGGALFGKLVEPGVFLMECLSETTGVREGCTLGFCAQKLIPEGYRGFRNSKKTSKKFLLRDYRGNYGICKVFAHHEG